ncbi:MAG: metallophosphoesterase family protein [Gemmatimonadaceae bacterium]
MHETAWHDTAADVRLLCLHQCVEGATVGPANFTFTTGADVIRGADIPNGFAAVLSGHIHRHQILMRDLRRRALAAPVLYPGSIERCSFAEADEEKGYMIVEVAHDDAGVRVDWSFRTLPARPLVRHTLNVNGVADADLEVRLRSFIDAAPADAVLTIRVEGTITESAGRLFSAAHLRSLAPATMNVELRPIEPLLVGVTGDRQRTDSRVAR